MLTLNRIRTTFIAGMTLMVLLAGAVFTTPAFADGGTPTSSGGTTTTTTSTSTVPSGTSVVVLDNQGHKVPLGSQKAADIINTSDPVWCPSTISIPTPGSGGCSPAADNTDLNTLITAITTHSFTPPAANSTIWIEGSSMSGTYVWLDGGSGQAFNPWANYTLTLKGGWNGCNPTCVGTVNPLNPSTASFNIWITNWNNNVTVSNLDISGSASTGLTITTTKNITLTNVQSNNNTGSNNGLSLDTTINSGTGSITIVNSQFNGNSNYGANITAGTGGIVTISGSQFNSNAGSAGLYVTASGPITLSNVTASSNTAGNGAYLVDNGNTAAVTINGASNNFSSNYGTNLFIQSKSTVTLANMTANGSLNGYGVQIDNTASTSNGAVTLSGVNTFNSNYYSGLYVQSKGAITANDLTVSGNGLTPNYNGAYLVNNNTGAVGGVTLTGVNIFDGNGNYGLQVTSYGAIKANSLIALGNHYEGVYLDNCNMSGSSCTTPSTQSITLTGSSQFKDNGGNGLDVISNGLITANNITALSNSGSFGASFKNALTGVTSGITLTGTNIFNDNIDYGLGVYSNGIIQLNSITANSNNTVHASYYYGADIENSTGTAASNVIMTGVNVFNGNYSYGLYISSAGSVTASSLTANNQQTGAMITAAGAVTLTGSNTFNFNQLNGLQVYSHGAIATNNLMANNNGQVGAWLDNCRNLGSGCSVTTAQSITLNGTNTFTSNVNEGLIIFSKGSIKTNNLNANCNGLSSGCGSTGSSGYGVQIDNCQLSSGACTGNGTVTIAGVNTFNGNYTGGLNIQSQGAIALNSITANSNTHGYGISVENTDSTPASPQTITLTGTNVFNGNNWWGADLSAYGKIAVSNVTANWNGATGTTPGLNLNNYNGNTTARPLASITLSGVNSFIGNYGDGLDISASGAVSVSNVTSNGSVNGYGLSITNTYFSGSTQGMTLTSITASGNAYGGLVASSHGAISGSNLTASNNDTSHTSGIYGADIETDGSSLTLSSTNIFNNNYFTNLKVNALGAMTINNLQASGSVTGKGADITVGNLSTASVMSLTGSNVFQNNYLDGLNVSAYGPIAMNNVTANGNGIGGSNGYGVYLWNSNASTPQKVTLTGSYVFNNNYLDGLYVLSNGAISLNNITANNSQNGFGVDLPNPANAAGVTLTGSNTFTGNYYDGLYIRTAGAITAANLNASSNGSSNGYEGAYLDAASSKVTLTGINVFNGNGKSGVAGSGLWINSASSVSLSSITAGNNAQDGLSVITTGNLTITCGSFTSNAGYGINGSIGGTTLTLTGVTLSGNTAPQITYTGSPTVVTTRDCPLP